MLADEVFQTFRLSSVSVGLEKITHRFIVLGRCLEEINYLNHTRRVT